MATRTPSSTRTSPQAILLLETGNSFLLETGDRVVLNGFNSDRVFVSRSVAGTRLAV